MNCTDKKNPFYTCEGQVPENVKPGLITEPHKDVNATISNRFTSLNLEETHFNFSSISPLDKLVYIQHIVMKMTLIVGLD